MDFFEKIHPRNELTSAETLLTAYWMLPTTPINHGIFLSSFLIYYLCPELVILYNTDLNSERKITPQIIFLFSLKTKYHIELQNKYTITKENFKENNSFLKYIIFLERFLYLVSPRKSIHSTHSPHTLDISCSLTSF